MADNRHKVVKHFRFTETEAKTLRKFAKMYGMTDSDYMRFLLSQNPEDYPEIRQMLSELINEVNHIGNNINQIARKNNAGWGIDYFIVSELLKDRLVSANIHTEVLGSDHCPVELDVEV